MKQTIAIVLATSLVGVHAEELVRSSLLQRGLFGGDSTTKTTGGTAGRGGSARSGKGGRGGTIKGPKIGKQKNTGANGGNFKKISTDMRGAHTGMQSGSASGSVSGNIHQNAAAPLQFYGGMFDAPLGNGMTINSNSGMGNIGSGGDSRVSGSQKNQNGGLGNGVGNGGSQGGSQSNSGSYSADGGRSGNARGARGGSANAGGGNSSQGGKGSLDFSPTLSVPAPAKRALERRALELEEKYAWVLQQKRDLEDQEALVARFVVAPMEDEFLEARSDDPDAEAFDTREADLDFDDEDYFQGLNARDVLEFYQALGAEF